MWSFEATSVIGASHVRKGTINQDRIGFCRGDGVAEPLILAVADGHGSAAYFRSHVGAEIAVDVACVELANVCQHSDAATIEGMSTNERWLFEDRIARRIVAEWTNRVRRHIDEHPVEEEAQSLDVRAYGCTLLAAAMFNGRIFALQIGDGDIVACSDDGAPHRLIAADTSLIANETHSLCQKNAATFFRFSYVAASPQSAQLLLMCTDGFSNSFASSEGFLEAVRDIHGRLPAIERGSLESVLTEWAQTSTDAGSGDDVSIVLAFDEPAYYPRVEPESIDDVQLLPPPDPPPSGTIWIRMLRSVPYLLLGLISRLVNGKRTVATGAPNTRRDDDVKREDMP